MANRVTFSGDHQSAQDIALHHSDLGHALTNYFSASSSGFQARFVGYSAAEVMGELRRRLAEIDLSSSLSLLAATEASFRIDYLQRCQLRKRDPISRKFRVMHAERGSHVSFEEDILGAWNDWPGATRLIGELRGAFHFRHWLAHGRYWRPKLGRKYGFDDIFTIADAALRHLPLIASGA
jgi:hypothetical protein